MDRETYAAIVGRLIVKTKLLVYMQTHTYRIPVIDKNNYAMFYFDQKY